MTDEKLIENLENQLQRLVEQLNDIESCKDEFTQDEQDSVKAETLEQIQDFTDTINRLQKGDLTLNSKVMQIKTALREAIGTAFNTHEIIRMFGEQYEELAQLLKLEEDYRLKKINLFTFNQKKLEVLQSLKEKGGHLSAADMLFLKNQQTDLLSHLEQL